MEVEKEDGRRRVCLEGIEESNELIENEGRSVRREKCVE